MSHDKSNPGWRRALTLVLLIGSWAGSVEAGPPPPADPAPTGADPAWLRYEPLDLEDHDFRPPRGIVLRGEASATLELAREELQRGLEELTGTSVPVLPEIDRADLLVVLVGAGASIVESLGWTDEVATLGSEGFLIRTSDASGQRATVLAAATDRGALYGAFELLRRLQTMNPPTPFEVRSRPRIERRLLNHWDNLDRSVERGYAGASLWEWDALPGTVSPRMTGYARLNASVGINGTVLNNVNASPTFLSSPYLAKAAALADHFRPWGIRVYLSANFASPMVLGDLPTADPLDPGVRAWWKNKVDEIYGLIPDFGGFLVKANSEGQPGPQDFDRSHSDGANLLANALAPHDGVVFWRAFVYDADVDPDRIKRSYLEFVPIDEEFRENVFVQTKNGPLDFQPREPFHPLFGALRSTKIAAELQVTQEYLGHSTHLVYLGPLWQEFLDADTWISGPGSTVARAVDGSLHGHADSAIAGVANTGTELDWTGHPFGQANWYAFARLAWNPSLPAEALAEEWIRQTWSRDPKTVDAIRDLMMESREIYVRYTMPLGLHHLIGGDHYAPMPENPDPRRADWSAIYYHRADSTGLGVDRTASGTGALQQYAEPWRQLWSDPATCPENLLLWFHRRPWDHEMRSGRTLWQEIVATYRRGAREAEGLLETWRQLGGALDGPRYREVLRLLELQVADAHRWSAHCIDYFDSQRTGRGSPPSTSP